MKTLYVLFLLLMLNGGALADESAIVINNNDSFGTLLLSDQAEERLLKEIEERKSKLPFCEHIVLDRYQDCCENQELLNVFTVTRDYLLNVPRWDIDSGNPPINIDGVLMNILEEFKSSKEKRKKEFIFNSFSLVSTRTSVGIIWYFYGSFVEKVKFKELKIRNHLHGATLDAEKIIVLMDGTVVREKTMNQKQYKKLIDNCK